MPISTRTIVALIVTGGAAAALAAPALAAGDPAEGKVKARACIACHGKDGLSTRPDAPHIAGQVAMYLREQLLKYRSGERTHAEMNIVAGGLSDADIDDLTAYYSSIEITVELPE
jgi:cytochrome c553